MAEYLMSGVCIAFWVVIIYAGYKLTHPDEDEDMDFFNSKELQDDIEVLHKRMQRLAELDNMMMDLQLCRPSEVLRAFRMEWQGIAKNHAVDFMADGQSDTSEILMQLAQTEREQINDEIGQRIATLYAKACKLQLIEDLSE